MLRRERANSLPILEAWKQGEKRKERQEEKGEIEGLEGFRKSVKVYRSPVKATGEGGERGISKEGFEEVIKEMRSGFARIQAQMEEVREIKKEADKLKREGKQVKIGYKKIWVNKEMWIWDDLKEELRKWDGAKEFEKEGNKRKKVIADRLNARIENKDEDFWKNMEKWEVIYMCETWLEEKKWKGLRSKLPKGYKWINKGAEKKNKKEGNGGMVMGWREELEGEEELEFKDRKGMIGIKIKSGKLKKGKAAGSDGLENEIWKWGGGEVKEKLWETCKKVWRGEGVPEEWREGVIVPVLKRGKGEKVEEYRGITLTQAAYKVYASVLAERLRKEIEEKEILPQSQAGFRRDMGTVDQIYVLNYLLNKKIEEKEGKMVIVFIDMKAAFDSVDRRKLVETMKKRGVREGLIRRCEEILEETVNKVKVKDKEGKSFWTTKGVRQGCPLSPSLFTLLLADIDEELERGGWGGIRIKDRRVYSLAYADDIALLAENEAGMKGMIKSMEEYVKEKGLEVNVKKTKIMRCRKGGGRWKKTKWVWKGEEIEEVKSFKYLGYTIMRNGEQKEHVKDRVRRAARIMGQVWSIGKRKFGKDWSKRIWLFDKLVWSVINYGVEIWGWKEREEVEILQEKYLRWVLGVRRYVPGYMVREELQRDKLKGRAEMRAWKYEKRLEEGKGGVLAKWCWEEMKERAREGRSKGKWEKEREEFFEKFGWSGKEMEDLRERGEIRGKYLVKKNKEWQREERWKKIRESRFNKYYKKVKEEGIPGYLKLGWKEEKWQRMAKFRLGEEMRGNKYWEEEEKRKCRICLEKEETWEHIWEECIDWGNENSWEEMVEEILGGEGKGIDWLENLERTREKNRSD
ncbi:calponin homology domain-containing protein DDB_G0272472-like [Cardiocondyla obscurior]|uniref:calponin homology domain-containing protein DDB_G0272472-like n=1 Tax=Cardiocondyla obscurior TaxID=286306 RepID=UPI0039655BB3